MGAERLMKREKRAGGRPSDGEKVEMPPGQRLWNLIRRIPLKVRICTFARGHSRHLHVISWNELCDYSHRLEFNEQTTFCY